MKRSEWLDLARKVNWKCSYVSEMNLFPDLLSGQSTVSANAWKMWDEPYKTSYSEYIAQQFEKDQSLSAIRELFCKEDYESLPLQWVSALKFYSAVFPLAEYAAVVGNLRASRFARDSAWRSTALLGALDELRHTQIPLLMMSRYVKWDSQFDWTHRFYHSNNWVSIAARHLLDELLILADPIEFAVATHFVFETAFTNLQFIGLSSMAHSLRDRLFEKMIASIQSDEARHAQIGSSVLSILATVEKEKVQYWIDKWFWRSWQFFSVITGLSMDYFTPLEGRKSSFKKFVDEWIIDQFLMTLDRFGLKKPWYWETFLSSTQYYHHMVYLTAYTYRSTVWFDFVLPSPEERQWLSQEYPEAWSQLAPAWNHLDQKWTEADPKNDMAVHGTAIVAFCELCQLILSSGTPHSNSAQVLRYKDRNYIFCSEPCRWIFEKDPERYASHKGLVQRVLQNEAPGNVISLIRNYFGLDFNTWGKDLHGGSYSWIDRSSKAKPGPTESTTDP